MLGRVTGGCRAPGAQRRCSSSAASPPSAADRSGGLAPGRLTPPLEVELLGGAASFGGDGCSFPLSSFAWQRDWERKQLQASLQQQQGGESPQSPSRMVLGAKGAGPLQWPPCPSPAGQTDKQPSVCPPVPSTPQLLALGWAWGRREVSWPRNRCPALTRGFQNPGGSGGRGAAPARPGSGEEVSGTALQREKGWAEGNSRAGSEGQGREGPPSNQGVQPVWECSTAKGVSSGQPLSLSSTALAAGKALPFPTVLHSVLQPSSGPLWRWGRTRSRAQNCSPCHTPALFARFAEGKSQHVNAARAGSSRTQL